MRYDAGSCDVAVVGAGHAGIEAALAAARLGLDTVCFTINMDAIGNMPCNPAIGGTDVRSLSCRTSRLVSPKIPLLATLCKNFLVANA